MAKLSYQEKSVLEELFGMSTGYVMDFSNNTFERFIGDAINIDIYNDSGYEEYASKANKLRQIWNEEQCDFFAAYGYRCFCIQIN